MSDLEWHGFLSLLRRLPGSHCGDWIRWGADPAEPCVAIVWTRACVRQWWEKKSERKKEFRVISEIKPIELWINWVSGQKGDRGLEGCQVSGFYGSLHKAFTWPTGLEGRTGDLGGLIGEC